jgi:hypothetical protein
LNINVPYRKSTHRNLQLSQSTYMTNEVAVPALWHLSP